MKFDDLVATKSSFEWHPDAFDAKASSQNAYQIHEECADHRFIIQGGHKKNTSAVPHILHEEKDCGGWH